MKQWWCQRPNAGVESKKDVTEYTEKVIDRRINKSSAFQVYQIDQSRYEGTGEMKTGIVNLESRYYTYGKWQLSGIPCTHVMAVFKELRYQHCSAWVSSYFTMETYCSTYVEVVFPVPILAEYDEPNKVMVVLPPLMDKRQVGRLKDHNYIPSHVKVRFRKNILVAKGSVTQAETVTLRSHRVNKR
uniref:Zinc finger PMZ-type domain-containing protein n=1 Tax=Lactuca sativa TaxID=4236 RepID=A0A9R1WCB6_LACSA|nr:hypothetical protein LSAT_V11C200071970 [Lactuca sativa]